MIETLTPWAMALVLILAGGSFGWSQIKKHGQEKERRKQAEGERDDAIEESENAARPPLTGKQSVSVLRRLRAPWRRRR